MWLFQKIHITFWTNQMQNLNQSQLGHSPSPCAFSSLIFSLLWLAVLIVLVLVFQNLIKKCSNWERKNRCKVQENLVWYTVSWNNQMRNICFSTRNQILYRFVATLNFWLPIRVYKNLLLNLLISSCLANLCQVYW